MSQEAQNYVIGPTGRKLTLADLPAPGTMYWVDRRKADVVAAVRGGLISFDQARTRYMLSAEEFISWQKLTIRERRSRQPSGHESHVIHH
jgi:hypothetical protein